MIYSTIPKQPYDLVYTDPPWQISRGGVKKSRPNSSGKPLDYPTLPLSTIKDMHSQLNTNNIFMWTIEKYLYQTETMMYSLGYTLHCRIIWDKGRGQAPAYTLRFTHEYLLWFYKKGHILKPAEDFRGVYPSVIHETNTYHSHKPETAYTYLETMFPAATKLELFSRQERPGWDSFGNEVKPYDPISA